MDLYRYGAIAASLCCMTHIEIVMQTVIEGSDYVGLMAAWNQRVGTIKPIIKLAIKAFPEAVLEKSAISKLKARSRRHRRTYKGLKQVMSRTMAHPKPLDASDLGEMKQALEEMRRSNNDLRELIKEFDTYTLSAASRMKPKQLKAS
jgi:hypothetical protein